MTDRQATGVTNISGKDEQPISLLPEKARLSASEIARRMSASRTAAQMRLQELERNGVIDEYSVRLSKSFTKDQVRVMIKCPPLRRSKIENALRQIPRLTTLYSISGVFDLSAEISAASDADLDVAVDDIGQLDGVDDTMSSVIPSTKIDR